MAETATAKIALVPREQRYETFRRPRSPLRFQLVADNPAPKKPFAGYAPEDIWMVENHGHG